MNSAKTPYGLNNDGQSNRDGHVFSKGQQPQDYTMALVYPDGRVTNVKVRPKNLNS